MKKGDEKIKLGKQEEEVIEQEEEVIEQEEEVIEQEEEVIEQEEGLNLIQTVIDEHGTVKSKTYKNMKTGEETVETF